jgi:hypothetical protein
MRYIVFIIFVILNFNGCKKNDIVTPTTEPTLSVSAVKDSTLYTFAISKAVFEIHDTLSASVTAYNQTAKPETLVIGPSQFSWYLQNNSGRTIMYGPRVVPLFLVDQEIEAHQSVDISRWGFYIHQEIADTSGQPVTTGTYSLHANIWSGPSFLLDVSLK